MEVNQILDMVVKYGATPLLLLYVYWLRKDIVEVRQDLKASDKAHKADLRKHADELKSFIENLNK